MSTIFLALDDDETPIPDADKWETGLTVRADDASVGLGFVLRNQRGDALAGACMTPKQAIEQGLWLVRNAARMMRYTNPDEVAAAALRMKVELSLIVAETEKHAARPSG